MGIRVPIRAAYLRGSQAMTDTPIPAALQELDKLDASRKAWKEIDPAYYEFASGQFREALENAWPALRAALQSPALPPLQTRPVMFRAPHMGGTGYVYFEDEAQAAEYCANRGIEYDGLYVRKAGIAASGQQATPPDGWKKVPVEPTQTMVHAAYKNQPDAINVGFGEAYRAMLSAAPTPPCASSDSGTREDARLESLLSDCENDFIACPRRGHEDDNAIRHSNLFLKGWLEDGSCGDCGGRGFSQNTDEGGNVTGIEPCERCDGTGLASNPSAQAPEAQGVPNAAMEAMREAAEFLWWPYWHGSGDRGTHVMRIKEPFSTNYSGEIAYFGNPGEGYDDPRHAAASALCDEHNAIVRKLRDALAAISQSQPLAEKGGAR